jgi:hypothetical protein
VITPKPSFYTIRKDAEEIYQNGITKEKNKKKGRKERFHYENNQ